MKQMTPAQREEQIKILNSLTSKERLSSFTEMLRKLTSRKGQEAGSDEQQEKEEPDNKPTEKPATSPQEWVPPADPLPGQARASEFNYF